MLAFSSLPSLSRLLVDALIFKTFSFFLIMCYKPLLQLQPLNQIVSTIMVEQKIIAILWSLSQQILIASHHKYILCAPYHHVLHWRHNVWVISWPDMTKLLISWPTFICVILPAPPINWHRHEHTHIRTDIEGYIGRRWKHTQWARVQIFLLFLWPNHPHHTQL